MARRTRDRGQPKVLVIDDEPDLLELLELTLSRMGLDTTRAQSVSEAIQLLDNQAFDLCLTDMRLPDGEGLAVVEHITEKALDVPVAVITAFGSAENAVAAFLVPAARRIAGDHAGAVDDRPALEEPGTGLHHRRVGQREGTGGEDD